MNQLFASNQQVGTNALQTDMGMGKWRLKKCTKKNALKHVIQKSGESEAEKIAVCTSTTQAYFKCHQTSAMQYHSEGNDLEVHEVKASRAESCCSDSSIPGMRETFEHRLEMTNSR
ncbi:unnamed protein product [Hymenolepis diminuta]|uniref:Uncharacterized protein n=1 Tax=Hymenolepis diminuta TaxID=6216 RepID=A0A564ZCU2_HYMDI|nr:unnamed protein product [Hymenolepis diminuta]